jgi:MerR family transcriptional regulator/heat shock protein HspR
MKIKRNKAYYSISAVAKMFSVHQQTIRLYEKEGLLAPKRSDGNTRLFAEEDIDRLEEIIYLTHKLGINLAGVEMIFKLKKQLAKMQKDMNSIFEDTNKELDQHVEASKQTIQESTQQLVNIKRVAIQKPAEEKTSKGSSSASAHSDEPVDVTIDNWDIEYED